jgi:NTP pyrophosphatase (non-canonical NTP hydrolase)
MKRKWLPKDDIDKLLHVAQECAELIQEITKAGMFGLNNRWEDKTNEERIRDEIEDVLGAIRRWQTHDSNMVAFAESELEKLMPGESNEEDRHNILAVIETVASIGMSGGSASMIIPIIERLMTFTPLTPLTGEDDEWTDMTEHCANRDGRRTYQNKRCSTIFKYVYPPEQDRPPHCFDVDGDHAKPITFPHRPEKRPVRMPVYEVELKDG